MSLTVYAMSTCDCHILYRIAGHKFNNITWSTLYGGGVKKLLRAATTNSCQVFVSFCEIVLKIHNYNEFARQ